MKNKILFAAALTAALAVSMMGTSVMAYDGTTKFTYTPGTSGPIDPVNPGDEETSENNWMVHYPRNIVLMDNNEMKEDTISTAANVGQKLTFKVTQRQAGSDGSTNVTAANVGTGITVAAGGWTSTTGTKTDIEMAASAGGSKVVMGLTDVTPSKFLAPSETMMTLTDTLATDDGYAVIKKDNVKKAVEGVTYTKDVTFTFTKGN